jgi:RNA polymerase sigma-70 factor (ECF subfamily)
VLIARRVHVVSEDSAEFIRLLTDHQVDLQAFILSSLGDYANTLDVLQRTNVVLWQKAAQFHKGAPFLPWALKVAKFEILSYMRVRRRDRHVFCPEVVELMVDTAIERSAEFSPRCDALRQCIKELPERSREFLRIRYAQEQSVKQISEKTGRSIDAVKSLYHRIRMALARCIDRMVVGSLR